MDAEKQKMIDDMKKSIEYFKRNEEIIGLVEKELLNEGYPPEEVIDQLSKATVTITESVVTANYDNGKIDFWDIVMKPALVHRGK